MSPEPKATEAALASHVKPCMMKVGRLTRKMDWHKGLQAKLHLRYFSQLKENMRTFM